MELRYLFLLALMQPVLVYSQLCPSGWSLHDDSCYQVFTEAKNYYEAQTACLQLGGDLAMAKTDAVNVFLTKLIQDAGVTALIGLHDQGEEDTFHWVDGNPLTTAEEHWNQGEPNNVGGEDCVVMRYYDGLWNDVICSYEKSYICERSNDLPLACDEKAGWYSAAGKCFKFYNFKRTWSNAEKYCGNVGGNLISINSEEEQTYAATVASTKQASIWLGLSDLVTGAEGNYKWSTTESITYSNWALNQPDNKYYTLGGNCAGILGSSRTGKWSTNVCTSTRKFICERPEGVCPDGWHLYRGYCYQYNTHHKQNWLKAKLTCEAQGTYLLTLLSSPESLYIVDEMKDLSDVEIDTIWLGMSDHLNGGDFRWVEGSSVGYTFWATNQPTDTAQTADCAYATTGDGVGKWSTGSCADTMAFVCKVRADQPISAIDPVVGIGQCEATWTLNGVSCYFFEWTFNYFNDAETNCVSKGAHLTSINSPEEQSFMTMRSRMRGINLWIGFTDINHEGTFSWTDGSSVVFTNWGPNQPNNGADSEDCAHMRGGEQQAGLWHDNNCETKRFASICKKAATNFDPNPPVVVPTPVFDARCGNGWDFDATSGNCYLFRYTDYQSWDNAREYCRVQGGDLTSITNPAEQAYLTGMLVYSSDANMWVGGNDKNREGGWEWSDGSGFGFLNWNENEPNNVGGEHCMEIFTDRDTWNDNKCERERGFVCKKNGYLTTHYNVAPHSYETGPAVITMSDIYPALCSAVCVKNTAFTCMAFNYNRLTHECSFFSSATTTPMGDTNMDYYTRLMNVPDVTQPPTLGPNFRCPANWAGYGDYCYSIDSKTSDTYDGMKGKCLALGATLASIHDVNENSFLLALANENGAANERLWIGLNDRASLMSFQWEDHTPVDFTLWNSGEPNNYAGRNEDCVEMYPNGYWNDLLCSDVRKAVCKKPKENLGPTLEPITPVGCNLGEVANGGSCYSVMDSSKNWQDALTDCQRFGTRGSLVSIADRYEQSVLSSILGSNDGSLFWIGLNDLDTQGEYAWSDNTFVTFTNWDFANPDDSKGRCVASTSGLLSGLWRNVDCDSQFKYVCKRGRDGYPPPTTIPPPTAATPPNDVGCRQDQKWKGYKNNCFMIVQADLFGTYTRTFEEAQTYCQAMGANLASFHGQDEEDYIMSLSDDTASYWIGLHDISQEGGFEWTDGTPVDHTNWQGGEPNDWGWAGEDCTEAFFTSRNWNDNSCDKATNWICKAKKGDPITYTAAPPTTVTPWPSCGTNADWIRWTDSESCYFFSHGLGDKKNWMEANEFCMQNNGYLISIHSDAENTFFKNYLVRFGETVSDSHTWIGMREYTTDGIYSWSDSSPVDYTNWAPTEPNDYNGEEQCAEFYHSSGTWNDVNCGKEAFYTCKKHFGAVVPVTYPPTQPPVGNCLSGWIRFDNRCYKINGDQPEDRMGWMDARDACRAQNNADLVTIHSHELQAFLNTMMQGRISSSWIGLSDTVISGRFYWTDGSAVDYTNWNGGEPNNWGAAGEDCTETLVSETVLGRWNDRSCDTPRSSICQAFLDPNAPTPTPTPNSCREGFEEYGAGCYQVLDLPYSFAQAQQRCQDLGSDVFLASVTSWYEEYFAETMSHRSGGEPLWIGMYSVDGEYQWSDGWPIWFTSWAFNEPSAAPGEGCVSLLPSGGWDDTACTTIYKPLCKYNTEVIPTEHPDVPGDCPDDWMPYHRSCYKAFNTWSDRMSWPEAEFFCEQKNGSLASIHSQQEAQFIFDLAKDGNVDIFIGMTRGPLGGFVWSDGTAVDYTNWNPGEPSYPGQPGYEDCVEQYLSVGKWNDIDCLYGNNGYVCKQEKTNMVEPTREPVDRSGGGMSGGVIAGIVVGVLVIVSGISIIIFFLHSRQGSLKMTTGAFSTDVPGTVGFDNELYKANGDTAVQVKVDSKA